TMPVRRLPRERCLLDRPAARGRPPERLREARLVTTRSLLTAIFAVALAAAGTVWIKSLVPPESPAGSLQFLSAAPELPIFDRAGAKTDLSKEKGKLYIIHFWATFCPPCVEEIPALSAFWDKYRARGNVELFAISVDKDWKTIDDFMKKHPSA